MCSLRASVPVAAWLVLFTAGASAQQQAQAPADTAAQAEQRADGPGIFEVATRWRQVADSAAEAERAVERLAAIAGLRADLEEAARRQSELSALVGSMAEADYVRPERISRLRDQALLEDQRVEALRERTSTRLEQLGALRGEWGERQRFWRSWERALRDDPDYATVRPTLTRAVTRIDTVLSRVSAGLTELLAVQREAEELRAGNERIRDVLDALRSGRRRALLERGEPVLFSAEHREQLATGGWRAWNPLANIRLDVHATFLRDHLGFLLFHVLLAFGLGMLARRMRPAARRAGGWSGLLEHPWALGVFATVVLALQRVVAAPPLWDVLLWALLGGSAALLSGRMFRAAALRLTVYLIAAFYPLFLALEVARLPAPVFRTGLAVVAAVAVPVFLLLARRTGSAPEGTNQPRHIRPLRISAAMWAVVLVAVVLGYDALGRWILHATVTSAAVAFVVVVLLALVQGALTNLLETDTPERLRLLRRVGMRLGRRLMMVVQVIVVAIAVLVLLDVWQIAESPLATWQRLTNLGFAIGSVRITIGSILLAVGVVYLAVLISWIIRTFVQSEVYRRWDFDRGVGDSINALVHYVLITIGILAALAVIGFELQNFAIVAGALGIGIGFGLQNVVNNFASGLILLFERPVRIGDTVVVDGEWGRVQKIGLRSTVLQTFDQSELIVPNADLVSQKVTNWTLSNPVARLILPVGVAYGSNIAQVIQILRDAAEAHATVLSEPPPQPLFIGFGDSSLDFELRVWVPDFYGRLEVQSAVLMDIEARLTRAGITIPFPQRDVHLRTVTDDD